MKSWIKKNLIIIFQLFFFIIFSNISHAFFSKEVILNCEPKNEYFEDTYKKIKYFRFDGSGEDSEIEFEWSPTEKKFLKKKNTSFKVREEFYEILFWDYYPETRDHRYREIYYIDRVKGTLRADMDRMIKKNYDISKYRQTTYYICKKIGKHRLPKKSVKKKF